MGILEMIANPAGVNLPDPVETYANTLNLSNLARAGRLGKMKEDDIVRQQAAMDALNKVLPDVVAANYSPESINAAIRSAPESGGVLLDMLDKKRKSDVEARKGNADAFDKETTARLKLAERFSNEALWLSEKKDLKPEHVAEYMKKVAGAGLQDVITPIPFEQWTNPEGARQGLAQAGQLFYDAKDRIANVEKNRGALVDEGNRAATLQQTITRDTQNNQVARGNLGVAQAREKREAEAGKAGSVQTAADGSMYVVDPRAASARPVIGPNGQPLNMGAKVSEAQKKALLDIDQQLAVVSGALEAARGTPSAFGMTRGMATKAGDIPETIAGAMSLDQEQQARSYVFNVVSKVINERAGAAQSAQELARLRLFLPAEMDNAKQIENKLIGFQTYLSDLRAGAGGGGGAPAPTAPSKEKTVKWGDLP
jgi:hypothetical protein